MRTLRQELQFHIDQHLLSEVLDRLADIATSMNLQSEAKDELVKALEASVRYALLVQAEIKAQKKAEEMEAQAQEKENAS
ncbi:MAG: hypothetical protein KME29_04875 [Calothrix sp. FI2-JRJ7]|jgi:hypothetical protein|nr:hypothetical protein [Calothrix sp. FI2-JRJ7]